MSREFRGRTQALHFGAENSECRSRGRQDFLPRRPRLFRKCGSDDIDLTVSHHPISRSVEVAHSADAALIAWGRLGVPEIWRFRPNASGFTFCHRNQDGSYITSDRSLSFPVLSSSDVLEQMRLANEPSADL